MPREPRRPTRFPWGAGRGPGKRGAAASVPALLGKGWAASLEEGGRLTLDGRVLAKGADGLLQGAIPYAGGKFVGSLALVSQGVVQTFGPYAKASVVQPTTYDEPVTDKDGKPVLDEKGRPVTKKARLTEQVIALGPVASQVAIKQLGTNGGGFFNVNSAHPYENPTPHSNFLELLDILLIPAALCHTFGVMVKDTRQGWAVLSAMTIMFVGLLALCVGAEQGGNPLLTRLGIDQHAGELAALDDALKHDV